MKTPEAILIFLLLSIIYKILPEVTIHPFLFAPMYESNLQFYFWSIVMRLILCYFIWVAAKQARGFEYNVTISFFWITLAKNIDFILCGNTLYFGSEWLSFNTISVFGFCIYIILQEWKSSSSHSLY